MLASRPGRIAGAIVPTRKAALTETPTRPAPNENHLLINAYTTHPQSPLLAVTRRISDSGCNLVDARLSTVGRDVSVTALATGSWDAVAKLETMLGRLEREEGLKLVFYRTGAKQVQSMKIDPEVVSKDDVEMLQDLIVAALNDAQRKADDEMAQKMGGMLPPGLKIPGL